ncbi:MAG: hypothetical protein Q8M37_09470 [Nevskia sp.]|nr:hypothetical protein [Nevskia sp.]
MLLPVVFVLGGCASQSTELPELIDPARYQLALKTDNPLQRGSIDRNPLLDGRLRFAAPASLLDYDARYSLLPSLPPADASAAASEIPLLPSQLLGGESFQQSLRMRLPFLLAQPLMISAQESTRGLLTPEALATNRSAQLQWSPAPVAIGLRWTPADAAAQALPFSCQLSGSLELPGALLTGSSGDGLKLQGQGCRASAPDRGWSGVEVSRYSATWQWQRQRSNSSVHLLVLEAAERLNANRALQTPGYELGASRSQTIGKLTADSSVAVRHASVPGDARAPFDWSARASLSRQYSDLLLSASLQREADPLWFLPNETPGIGLATNSVELGLAFDRWIARQLATRHVGLGLVGRWTEMPNVNQAVDQAYDYQVLWNLTLTP